MKFWFFTIASTITQKFLQQKNLKNSYMFSNKSISFSKKTQNSANYTSTIMDNGSAVLPASLLSASASLFNHFPGSLDLFGGDDSDASGPSPPPPPPSKTPIKTSTIV